MCDEKPAGDINGRMLPKDRLVKTCGPKPRPSWTCWAASLRIQPLQHVGGLEVLRVLARQAGESESLLDVHLYPLAQLGILA